MTAALGQPKWIVALVEDDGSAQVKGYNTLPPAQRALTQLLSSGPCHVDLFFGFFEEDGGLDPERTKLVMSYQTYPTDDPNNLELVTLRTDILEKEADELPSPRL